jgi:hypothetical protein
MYNNIIITLWHSVRQKTFLIGFITLMLCTVGCSSLVNDNPELPYDSKLVIQAYLQAGQPLNKILIGITSPILQPVSFPIIYLDDAEVLITVGGRTYSATSYIHRDTLRYSNSLTPFITVVGNAYRVPLTVQPGETYHIEVRRQGLVATASTTIPFPPTIENPVFESFRTNAVSEIQFRFTADVQYQPGTATRFYGVILRRDNGVGLFLGNTQGVKTEPQFVLTRATDSTSVRTATQTTPGGWIAMTTQRSNTRIAFTAQAMDEPFYSYYLSLDRSQDKDFEPFAIGSGSNTLWNVKGDGIGLWIGMATREVVIP